jgi:hypothetical protein
MCGCGCVGVYGGGGGGGFGFRTRWEAAMTKANIAKKQLNKTTIRALN